ncbi:MAG: sulfurtransferase-like selenium metabolism protein YedF [Sarcina sp.]
MKIINCEGLGCPIPVINTKKYFDTIEEGKAEVVVDNEVSRANVEKFAKNSGYEVSSKAEGENFILTIEKLNQLKEQEKEDDESFVILITSDEFGNGNPDLGKTLMKSYIYALTESSKKPTELIFLNAGVKLVIKDSVVLESLNELEKMGTSIYSCGACLDFYELKEQLAIGEVTNMYVIIEMMNNGKKVIKL